MNQKKKHILFLCVANSARSQVAEGLAKKILGDQFWIESAGSAPSGRVQPGAIQILKEVGIDITQNHSKSIQQLPHEFVDQLDYIITLCQEENCPIINTRAQIIAWPLPDPVGETAHTISEEERFRHVREQISERLNQFARNQ